MDNLSIAELEAMNIELGRERAAAVETIKAKQLDVQAALDRKIAAARVGGIVAGLSAQERAELKAALKAAEKGGPNGG